MSELPLVEINSQPIELCKLLKIANLVGGGGEAKMVISEGYVYLNGELETQKRKKVYENDVIEFNGEAVKVTVVKGSLVKAPSKQVDSHGNQASNKRMNKTTPIKDSSLEEQTPQAIKSKRKPISF